MYQKTYEAFIVSESFQFVLRKGSAAATLTPGREEADGGTKACYYQYSHS